MSVASAPLRPSRRSFLAAVLGLKSDVGFMGRLRPARVAGLLNIGNIIYGSRNLPGMAYAGKASDESLVCRGIVTLRPSLGGWLRPGDASSRIGASCQPSHSLTTIVIF